MLGRLCILCGRCLNVCPLVTATGREEFSSKSKHQLIMALAVGDPSLTSRAVVKLAILCLSCGCCATVCPQGLAGSEVAASLRAMYPDWRQRLWKVWILTNGLWPLIVNLGSILYYFRNLFGQRIGNIVLALDSIASLQTTNYDRRLTPWLRITKFDSRASLAFSHTGADTTVIFPGCLSSRIMTAWIEIAKWLVNALGYRIASEVAISSSWGCCGAVLYYAGLLEAYRKVAHYNLSYWRKLGRPQVVTFCASCRASLKAYATDTSLDWETGETAIWSASIRSLTSMFGRTKFTLEPEAPEVIYYHQPCRALPVDDDLIWLRRVLDYKLYVSGAGVGHCCGLGGVMQLTDAYNITDIVVAKLWQVLIETSKIHHQSIILVLTGCSGCFVRLHTTAPAGIVVGHWLEVLLPSE